MASENPFEGQADRHLNACVSTYLRYWELGDHYLQASDALIQVAVADHTLLDVHIYPVSFLYRHALELMLKESLWMSNYLVHGSKTILKTHKLSNLWQALKNNIQAIPNLSSTLKTGDAKSLERLFAQIEKHDPASDAFRYPYDRAGKSSHPSLRNVNVRVLYERVHHARNSLNELKAALEEVYLADQDGSGRVG